MENEYTLDELKSLDISGVVVEVLSEDVSVVRGGDTLKFKYYTKNKKEYTLKRDDDGGKTRWNLCLKRMSASTKKDALSVTITIPDDLLLKTIKVTSGSGNINFKDCTTDLPLAAESKTGSISINGGSPSGWFIVNTESGQIKELVLQSSVKSAKLVRTIYITLPVGTQYSRVVQLLSNTGSIQISHCKTTDMLSAETKAGNILAQSCNTPCLGLESKSGQIEASGCKTNQLNTKAISGTLTLKLPDWAANYKMVIDTGTKSQISINGKKFSGGEIMFNKKASKEILFDSNNGSLIITES